MFNLLDWFCIIVCLIIVAATIVKVVETNARTKMYKDFMGKMKNIDTKDLKKRIEEMLRDNGA